VYYVMLGAFLLWPILLFGGFAYGLTHEPSHPTIPEWTRLGSSFVLVVAAWGWCGVMRRSRVAAYGWLIAVGMTLGFVGDLFMAGRIPVGEPVIGGMGSFGLGHIAYLAAMIFIGRIGQLGGRAVRAGAWLAWLGVGVLGWYVIVYPEAPPLIGPVALGYTLLLASTAGCATGLALRKRAFVPLAVGAALFFVSDLMIAAEKFGGYHHPFIAPAIWLTYGPAQMLIVYSVPPAGRVAASASPRALTFDGSGMPVTGG
jgi:uncharacterized membrane protein YhhN